MQHLLIGNTGTIDNLVYQSGDVYPIPVRRIPWFIIRTRGKGPISSTHTPPAMDSMDTVRRRKQDQTTTVQSKQGPGTSEARQRTKRMATWQHVPDGRCGTRHARWQPRAGRMAQGWTEATQLGEVKATRKETS